MFIEQHNTATQGNANMYKTPNEYALAILDITGGNRFEAVKILFEAQEKYKLGRDYTVDVFNILTGN